MATYTRQCEYCGQKFGASRKDARYCCDKHRWSHNTETKYLMTLDPVLSEQEAKEMAKIKDPEAQRRGRANRAKGARAEREACHLIHDHTGDDVSRNLTQTRDAGGDVKWGPFYLEVKYQKNIAMPAWQQQATESAQQDGGGLIPAVVYRRPNEQFWVSIPFVAFLQLFHAMRKRLEELENGG